MLTVNTLEKLGAWLLFSFAILMVYGFLSMAWAEEVVHPNHDVTTTHYYVYCAPGGAVCVNYKSKTKCERAAHAKCTLKEFRGPMDTQD